MAKINIYCDESCHMLKDNSNVFGLGAITCLNNCKLDNSKAFREIKKKFGFDRKELKWSSVTKGFIPMYKEIIDWFFDRNSLSYRAVIVSNKQTLRFNSNEEYDQWYYKMYYVLLINIVSQTSASCSIKLDKKDTNGKEKIAELKGILNNTSHALSVVEKIEEVDSYTNDFVQLSDFFTGMLTYYVRFMRGGSDKNGAKKEVVDYIRKKTNIGRTTILTNNKFNIFYWGNR